MDKMVELLTEEQINDLTRAFHRFDKDGDGTISSRELSDVIRSMGQSMTEAEIQDMMIEVDTDGSGTIDLQEFIILMAGKLCDSDKDEDIIEAFKIFDADNNGFVTFEEFRAACQNLGEQLTDEEIMNIIREHDTDGDMQLNFEEFYNLMNSS